MSCMKILNRLRGPRSKFHNFPNFSQCNMAAKKRALVFLAPGFEEIEFITPVDVLRRGGVDVFVAGTSGADPICGANNIRVLPDYALCVVKETFDALILPGGQCGTEALAQNCQVGEMLREQEKCCKIIAAICAAPTALKAHGIGKGRNVTSYPTVEKAMTENGEYKYMKDDVVVDGFLITSRGPATAMKFGMTILKQLTDDVKACQVAKALLCM